MAFDYSASFGGINNALSNIGKQNELAWQRNAQADVGKSLQLGDYNAAAQKAFGYGDASTGLGLLKLGQAEKDRAADASLAQGLFGGGVPSQSIGALGQRPQGYFGTTASAESSGNPAAKNPNSSAIGLYQFTDGTWAGLMKSNPELGLTADGRTDPVQQQKAMQAFTGQNAKILQSQGIQPNDANLYMTHFLGAQGGPAFIKGLQSNPNAPATAYVDPRSVAANRSVFFNQDGTPRTAGEVYTAMTQRFGNGSTAVAALQGGSQPAQPQPQPVQVAENEADVQRLEAAQANGNRPADVPAPGAANAEFVIPGTNTTVDQQTLASNPRIQNMVRALGVARTERGQAMIKQALELEVADAKQRQAINQPTDLQKNYQAAVKQGYQGTIFDYQKELKQAGANPKAEDAYDQTRGKADAEYFVETQKGGRDASSQITTLKRMQSLLNDPNFYSGWNGGRATAFKKMAVSLGIKDAETAAPNELFDKLSKQAVLDKAGGSFGTGFSNGDRDYIDATTANINNTPEGNRQIIDMGLKVAQRRVEVSKMARDYARKNGGRLDSGFDDEVAAFAEKNPLFPQAPAAAPTPPAQASPSPAPAAPPPQRPAGGGAVTITNPKTGQRMMLTPNGTWAPFDG